MVVWVSWTINIPDDISSVRFQEATYIQAGQFGVLYQWDHYIKRHGRVAVIELPQTQIRHNTSGDTTHNTATRPFEVFK